MTENLDDQQQQGQQQQTKTRGRHHQHLRCSVRRFYGSAIIISLLMLEGSQASSAHETARKTMLLVLLTAVPIAQSFSLSSFSSSSSIPRPLLHGHHNNNNIKGRRTSSSLLLFPHRNGPKTRTNGRRNPLRDDAAFLASTTLHHGPSSPTNNTVLFATNLQVQFPIDAEGNVDNHKHNEEKHNNNEPPQQVQIAQQQQEDASLLQTNGRDPREMYIFCPAYLEQLDKNRGYRRKMSTKRRVVATTAAAASTAAAPSTTVTSATETTETATTTSPSSLDGRIPPRATETLVDRVLHKLGVSDDMKDDVLRRRPFYKSDWTDAFRAKRKIIPAILFLYFACLSPAVSFGTIASQITSGSMGIVEFLLSCGVSGMLYSILCGQPMTFIAPTGLTLAFISGLYRYCSIRNLPFFPVYSWVGIWTSIFFIYMGLAGCSQWIRFCTRFTDEVFNALLSLNFISEAVRSLQRNFQQADNPLNLTMPFVSLAMALTTFFATKAAATFESGKYFTQKVRTAVKDFGPVTIFICMSLLNQQRWLNKFAVPTLSVASTFQLAGGRQFFVDLGAVSNLVKLGCALPAVLLTSLFFMDQNISVRVVNNPDNKLKKGSAYNLDMVALGIITGLVSLVGLPWMCGATVQSLNHVKAMTETRFNEATGEPEIVDVVETRFTGFFVHAMIAGTLGLLPLLSYVPIPVVSGVFLFLGRKLMSGNSFLQRIRDTFVQETRLPEDHPIRFIGRKKTILFTAIQIACLWGLWTFKQNSATAIFFPSVIGFLMFIRSFILPRIFTEDELIDLGDPTPS
jgi:hypothetical protein